MLPPRDVAKKQRARSQPGYRLFSYDCPWGFSRSFTHTALPGKAHIKIQPEKLMVLLRFVKNTILNQYMKSNSVPLRILRDCAFLCFIVNHHNRQMSIMMTMEVLFPEHAGVCSVLKQKGGMMDLKKGKTSIKLIFSNKRRPEIQTAMTTGVAGGLLKPHSFPTMVAGTAVLL